MNGLYETDLIDIDGYESMEDYTEDTGIYNNADYIIEQFYNGNWNDGVKSMLDVYVTPNNLVDYIECIREEMGSDVYSFMDNSSFVTITQIYYTN